MATRKSDVKAPAANPLSPLDAVLVRVASDKANIQKLAEQSRTAGEDQGYGSTAMMAAAIGMDINAIRDWVPQSLGKHAPDESELKVRRMHMDADPKSAEPVVTLAKDRLQLVIDASPPATVAAARKEDAQGNASFRIINTRTKDRDQAAARQDLENMRDALPAGSAARKVLDDHVSAIGNVAGLQALGMNVNTASKFFSRFRSFLYLPVIEQTFFARVPEHARGKTYRAVASAAAAAHKAWIAKHATQHATTESLQKALDQAVITATAAFDLAKPDKPDEVRAAEAVAALYSAAGRCVKYGRMSTDALDVLRSWLVEDVDPRNVDTAHEAQLAKAAAAEAARNAKKKPALPAPSTTRPGAKSRRGKSKSAATPKPATKAATAPAQPAAPANVRRQVASTKAPPAARANVATKAGASAGAVLGMLKRGKPEATTTK
jgi:hypothetical protein